MNGNGSNNCTLSRETSRAFSTRTERRRCVNPSRHDEEVVTPARGGDNVDQTPTVTATARKPRLEVVRCAARAGSARSRLRVAAAGCRCPASRSPRRRSISSLGAVHALLELIAASPALLRLCLSGCCAAAPEAVRAHGGASAPVRRLPAGGPRHRIRHAAAGAIELGCARRGDLPDHPAPDSPRRDRRAGGPPARARLCRDRRVHRPRRGSQDHRTPQQTPAAVNRARHTTRRSETPGPTHPSAFQAGHGPRTQTGAHQREHNADHHISNVDACPPAVTGSGAERLRGRPPGTPLSTAMSGARSQHHTAGALTVGTRHVYIPVAFCKPLLHE